MRYVAWLIMALICDPAIGMNDEWGQFGGRDHFRIDDSIDIATRSDLSRRWAVQLGDGLSGIVTDSEHAYTLALENVETKSGKKVSREVVVAIDTDTGDVRWKSPYEAEWQDDQEAFGGRPRAPQATPAIVGDTLVTVGFTGIVRGLEKSTGDVLWQFNSVENFESKPVQFGFSASPIPFGTNVLVLIGGEKAGLLCLDATTGEIVWNVPCGEASYATPVLWKHGQCLQVMFQDRNQLVGVLAETGRVLWRYELPKSGLTNVPTPLPIDEESLVISGQGVGGTARLEVLFRDGEWLVNEIWRSRVQFFYCNWLNNSGRLVGCDGNLLTLVDVETGATLAKWRGFSDSNLIANSTQAWILDGKGKLSCLEIGSRDWSTVASYQLLDARCWTPPTVAGNRLYCRAEKDVYCFEWLDHEGGDSNESLVNLQRKPKKFDVNAEQSSISFTQQIIERFEESGPLAAFEVYQEIRKKHRTQFGLIERRELMKLASEQGFYQLAKLIAADAKQDFSETAKTADLQRELSSLLRQPARDSEVGTDGLTYVEFAMENRSSKPIDTYVRGPDKKRFNYGIPFPPGKFRIEKWPVGTKLYWAVDDVPGQVLLTVGEELAGKTVEVTPDPDR